ncbi:MAG: hypothetical protein AAFR21_17330 [Pseudomonadota bacterium]
MKTGDTHYQVSWSPKEKSETVEEAYDNELFRHFRTFRAAAEFACSVADDDFFGVVTIVHRTCESARYGWWSDDHAWYVEAGFSPSDIDPQEPDTVYG